MVPTTNYCALCPIPRWAALRFNCDYSPLDEHVLIDCERVLHSSSEWYSLKLCKTRYSSPKSTFSPLNISDLRRYRSVNRLMQMAPIANANETPQSIDFRWFHRFSCTYRFLLDANKQDPVTFPEDLFLESVRQSGALLSAMDVCYPGLCASRREFASVPPI